MLRQQRAATPQVPPSRNESDLLLLGRIEQGDRAALQELYAAYYHALLRFMQRITRSLELAQEGVNDVMLTVWRNSTSFGRRSSVSTWIMGIAYNKALKSLASKRRWSSRFGFQIDDFEDRSEAAVEPSEHRDLRDWLTKALDALPPAQRAVVDLTYFGGYSYEEIAAIMGCPVNTVKTRMFHARAKLRHALPALANGES
ncbi:MAG TPA: sigma-70 family RNA polymerase sigma factor [Gammaproteobacteria bacterium]|nr:sigma-70 family RNA polymerase sigma factor [Gammaproteobacteria bacterium]